MGKHGEKMIGCEECPGVTGVIGKANSNFYPPQTNRGPHHHIEAAVDWCRSSNVGLNRNAIHLLKAVLLKNFNGDVIELQSIISPNAL